jgi:glycosyltransferase involved in cell wall biosynthesis
MKVAVYTIALNEEKFVKRWHASAKEADYLLIADTGSSDNTGKTAQKLGINVISVNIKPWRFDDARNAALAAIPADIDYCIALDMDEILLPGWREELEKALKDGVTRPRYQYTWSWKDKKETVPDLVYGGDKIHARQGYRWKHPVHEVVACYAQPEVQGWYGLQIHHHPDHTKSRGQYFPLLKLAIQEDPEDDRNAFYYARELYFHGLFGEAAAEFKRHLALPKAIWAPERAASLRYLAKCDPGKAIEYLTQAAKEAPDFREPWVDLSRTHYYQASKSQNPQDWTRVMTAAEKALSISEKPLTYLNEADAWGASPHDLLAISAFNLGKIELAVEHGRIAASLDPTNARLTANVSFYEAALNQA